MGETFSAESFRRLDGLTAHGTCELLRSFFRPLEPEDRMRAARRIGVVLRPAQHGLGVELTLPAFSDNDATQRKLGRLFDGLCELYSHHTQRGPELRRKHEVERALPLAGGLAGFLLAGHSLCGDQPAPPRKGEFLAASTPGLSMALAAELFAQMSVQATATKWTVAWERDFPRYFFSGVSRPRRHGNLESIAPVLQSRFQMLRAFDEEGLSVFLPARLQRPMFSSDAEDLSPGVRTLSLVAELLKLCPEMLELPLGTDSSRCLLAVLPDESIPGDSLRAHLAALPVDRFHRNFFLEPEYQRIEVFPQDLTHSQAALNGLRSYLKAQRGCEGYRLELRNVRPARRDPLGLLYQNYQRSKYEYDLALASQQSQPALMRFSYQQLPEMARLLRELPFHRLEEGGLLYGCFTPEGAPALRSEDSPIDELSYHYLYFQEGWREFAESVWLAPRGQSGRKPARFQLDPFWSRAYNSPESRCLVFVPEGNALFPTLHGWDGPEMEAYLRDVLDQWLTPQQREHIGERPIFLFDGPYGSERDRIHISLLDLDAFRPFRQRMAWVNDHLDILQALDSDPQQKQILEARVAELAGCARWDAIHGELLDRGRRVQRQITDDAEQSHRELLDGVRGELSIFDEQLTDACRRLQTVHEQAQQLNAETEALRRELRVAEAARDEMLAAAGQLRRTTEDSERALQTWEVRAEQTLGNLAAARDRTEQAVAAAAEDLSESRRRLNELLVRIQQRGNSQRAPEEEGENQ